MQLENHNHLYQDDLPVGWASDVVCGIKRFYPKCRKSLQISAGYLRKLECDCVKDTGSPFDFRHLDVTGGCCTPERRDAFGLGIPVWFYAPVTHRGNCVLDTPATHLLRALHATSHRIARFDRSETPRATRKCTPDFQIKIFPISYFRRGKTEIGRRGEIRN